MPVDVGQIVASKYELVRLLGSGSMGEVWSAHHQALREQVAIKILSPPRSDDAEEPSVALARFRFEAQVAARLSRKTRHIAQVTDYGEDDGLPYLVMELLDGEALDAALRTRGTLPLPEVVEIVSQIARALYHAHAEGVAHRDLKPANVFLTHDEEGRVLVKLLDFGIARALRGRGPQGVFSTGKGFVFGTPGYMSPEQIRASPTLDHRCDLWALATIAYQMLTGKLPVDGDNADEVLKNVSAGRVVPLLQRTSGLPSDLGPFFERAFADRVEDRFAGAASLAQALEIAAGGGISRSFSTPSPSDSSGGSTAIEFEASVAEEPPARPRRPLAIVASAGAILAIVAIAGVRATLHESSNEPPPPALSLQAGAVSGASAPAPETPGIAAPVVAPPAPPGPPQSVALPAPLSALAVQAVQSPGANTTPAAAQVAGAQAPRRATPERQVAPAPRSAPVVSPVLAAPPPALAVQARTPAAKPVVSRDDVF
jgi:serine/threonine-protein kinase